MKKLIFVLTTVFLLVGCQSNEVKKAPNGQVIVDGKTYEMNHLQFEWLDGNLEIRKLATKTIEELVSDYEALPVKKGDELELQFEEKPDMVTVHTYNESGKQHTATIAHNKIVVPSEADDYFYEIIAQWDNGSTVSYVFSIQYSE